MLHNLLNSTAKATFFILAFIVLIILNFYIWKKDLNHETQIINLQKELTLLQQENEKIAKVNQDLKQKIESLKIGSLEMIEEKARNGFGMVSEGETYYHLNEEKDNPKTD